MCCKCTHTSDGILALDDDWPRTNVYFLRPFCVVVGYGNLQESDVLVLTLDVADIESHSAATDTVIKHFGQVKSIIVWLLS